MSGSDITVTDEDVGPSEVAQDVGGFEVEEVILGIHFEQGMDKKATVFGINVYKHRDVELWAWLRPRGMPGRRELLLGLDQSLRVAGRQLRDARQ